MQKIIEKIHRKFDTAGEKLLLQAKEIINAPMVNDTGKIERFQKIGFTSGKPIKDAEGAFKKQQEAKAQIEAIEYYQTYYPSYKFISEPQIQKICKKYGLLYGESKNYLGDIPEKNLSEIEAFKLREEDYLEETVSWMGSMFNDMVARYSSPFRFWSEPADEFPKTGVIGYDPIGAKDNGDGSHTITLNKGLIPTIMEGGNSVGYDSKPKEQKKQKPAFKICAPKKDFNTAGYEVKDGYKLIYDPIVIQPVKYKNVLGGLIISKWGLEGMDASLTNETNN